MSEGVAYALRDHVQHFEPGCRVFSAHIIERGVSYYLTLYDLQRIPHRDKDTHSAQLPGINTARIIPH